MTYRVLLLPEVADDLEDLFDYIALHDAPEKAVYVLEKIQELINSLSMFPERGSRPHELADTGHRAFRAVSFKPYRIIYRVEGDAVRVYLVADGRRNMQALLGKRLLEE